MMTPSMIAAAITCSTAYLLLCCHNCLYWEQGQLLQPSEIEAAAAITASHSDDSHNRGTATTTTTTSCLLPPLSLSLYFLTRRTTCTILPQ